MDEDGLTKRLYLMMGDRGFTRANAVSARADVGWRRLATEYDQARCERQLIDQMRQNFVRTAEAVLPIKQSDSPYGREFKMFGFVFNEDQLIDLLHEAYRMGLEDGRPKFPSVNV